MIKKTKWLINEAKLRVNYMVSKDCIFCKIAKGEIKTQLIRQTDKVIVFNDINPVAKIHILIVPKKHIDSVLTVENEDSKEIIAMFKAAKKIVEDIELDAYRLAFNGGKFQHVGHIHMHLIAGGNVKWTKL